MLKAIILDLDGIIVDSEPLHFEAAKKALQEAGIDLTIDEYLKFGVAKGSKNLFQKLSQKHNVDLDIKKLFLLKKEEFRRLFLGNIVPRDGIINLIENLSKDYTLAVASSGIRDAVDLVLEKLDIKKYFKVVITAEDVEKVKPHPDIYEKTTQELGFDKNECIAIEDSETGLLSAKAAGIKCVIVPCEFTKSQNFSQAELVLEDFSKINKELLESL